MNIHNFKILNLRRILTILLSLIITIPAFSIAGERVYNSYRHYPEVRKPARFNLVKSVQKALTLAGYNPGQVDGHQGSKTTKALKEFQIDKGLKPDGIIGSKTLQNLGLQE